MNIFEGTPGANLGASGGSIDIRLAYSLDILSFITSEKYLRALSS